MSPEKDYTTFHYDSISCAYFLWSFLVFFLKDHWIDLLFGISPAFFNLARNAFTLLFPLDSGVCAVTSVSGSNKSEVGTHESQDEESAYVAKSGLCNISMEHKEIKVRDEEMDCDDTMDSVEPMDCDETTDSAEPMDCDKTVDSVEPMDCGESTDSVEPMDCDKTVDSVEPMDCGESADSVEPMDCDKTVDSVEPMDCGEKMDSAEPMDCNETTDSVEPMDCDETMGSDGKMDSDEKMNCDVKMETRATTSTEMQRSLKCK